MVSSGALIASDQLQVSNPNVWKMSREFLTFFPLRFLYLDEGEFGWGVQGNVQREISKEITITAEETGKAAAAAFLIADAPRHAH